MQWVVQGGRYGGSGVQVGVGQCRKGRQVVVVVVACARQQAENVQCKPHPSPNLIVLYIKIKRRGVYEEVKDMIKKPVQRAARGG